MLRSVEVKIGLDVYDIQLSYALDVGTDWFNVVCRPYDMVALLLGLRSH